jgi:hypothetical protein
VVTRARQASDRAVAIAVDSQGPAAELSRALETRGVRTRAVASMHEAAANAAVVACCLAEAPSPEQAGELARACERAVRAGAPPVVLTAFPPPSSGRRLAETAAALAYMQAHGAILCADPDTWLETIVLAYAYPMPAGPRVAVVAPPGSWLSLSAAALAAERASFGSRVPPVHRDAASVGPVDVVLVDRSEITPSTPDRVGSALVVPVVGRIENLHGSQISLAGLRQAMEAVSLAGRASQRIRAGLGPADVDDLPDPPPDHERFDRQVSQLDERAGDHETKVLLKAYGVNITRQAVATTPSRATSVAKRAGFPVEMKPWSPDAPTEPEGCPVETDLKNAPDVRRAFVAIPKAAGLDPGSPVIVRETPPRGRELRARICQLGALEWTVIVDIGGAPGPIAAPAPLRPIDARELARYVEASRVGDPEPDREALAELLRRASHMVVAHQDVFVSLDLARVIVAPRGQGAVVVDARAVLTSR